MTPKTPSVCDTILSNHRNPEPVRSDSNLSNHDSEMAGCDNDLSNIELAYPELMRLVSIERTKIDKKIV